MGTDLESALTRIRVLHSCSKVRYSQETMNSFLRMPKILYPNPAEEAVILQFMAIEEGPVEVAVLSANAVETYSAKCTSVKGLNQLTMDIEALEHGMYFMRVRKGVE